MGVFAKKADMLQEVFDEALKTLDYEHFYRWVCGAYGLFASVVAEEVSLKKTKEICEHLRQNMQKKWELE